MTAPDKMATLWRGAGYGRGRADQSADPHGILFLRGLLAVVYDWRGFSEQYIAGFSEAHCARLNRNVRRADLADRPDGPRSFVTVTWAGRGTVPSHRVQPDEVAERG
jgi:hypothetical protein